MSNNVLKYIQLINVQFFWKNIQKTLVDNIKQIIKIASGRSVPGSLKEVLQRHSSVLSDTSKIIFTSSTIKTKYNYICNFDKTMFRPKKSVYNVSPVSFRFGLF